MPNFVFHLEENDAGDLFPHIKTIEEKSMKLGTGAAGNASRVGINGEVEARGEKLPGYTNIADIPGGRPPSQGKTTMDMVEDNFKEDEFTALKSMNREYDLRLVDLDDPKTTLEG